MPYLPFKEEGCGKSKAVGGHVCPGGDTPDSDFFDYKVTDNSIAAMALAKNTSRHFFVVCGYRRPHIPWHMPQRFFDMYADSDITLAAQHAQDVGANVSSLGYTQCGFSSPVQYNGKGVDYGPHKPLPQALQRAYRHGYYASVTWLDSQVGRLLAKVDELGMREDTIVALWGDHGWKLGEHSAWSKQDIWETGARVPLLIRAPWLSKSAGAHTFALAEIVDMYKTLADLAGLPPPPADGPNGVQGTSLGAILRDSAGPEGAVGVKNVSLTQFPRCGIHNGDHPWTAGQSYACMGIERTKFDVMGYAARTRDWRYIEWRAWDNKTLLADWTEVGLLAAGLYDHRNDTSAVGAAYFDWPADYINLVSDPAASEALKTMKNVLANAYHGGV